MPIAAVPDPVSDAPALRAFVAVARLGTVVRAAEALGRTQPSISARLAGLEDVWKVRLFRRRARGMLLTPEGARLLPLAEAALHELEALDRAAGRPMARAGEIRVGAGDALGREVLPRALSALLRRDTSLSVRLLEGSAPRLLEALRAGEIDVALAVLPDPPAAREGLDLEPLFESQVDLLLPPERAAGTRSVSLETLAGERLVALQPGSGFRRHVEAAFAARGLRFQPTVEVGNLSLVRRFVAAGLGLAPVPSIAFARRAPGPAVQRRALRGVPPVVYRAAVRSHVPLPPGAARLLERLRSARGAQG